MSDKILQTRIKQKIDTKANWDKAVNFVPLKGEIIVYSDLNKIKVGDGVKKVSELPFLADSDTHSITGMYVGATNAKANAATTNGNTYLKLYDDSTKRAEFKIVGSGATKVSSDANGNITISSTDTNTHQSVADKNPTLAWDATSTVATIGGTDIHVTMPGNPAPTNYVTTNTKQTITGEKTFNAPTQASGEQATAIFKTANGGQIIFGKEGPNSGSMIALDQVAGTRRLNFRASATPGAIVWSQPESGSSLYYDVSNVYFRESSTVVLSKMPNYSVLATDSSGKIIKGSPVQGPKGDKGAAGGFGTPTASVDANVGTPSVTITSSGPDTAKVFNFAFKNLKGEKGNTGAHISSVTGDKTPAAGNTVTYTMKNTDGTTAGTFKVVNGTNGGNGHNGAAAGFGTPTASITNTTGTPTVTVTASGSDTAKVFDFKFTNLKGATGAPGSVASFKAGSGSGNVITGLTLNSDKSVTYDKAIHALDMGTSSTVVNQVVYNPVEMKKALTVPSVQGTQIQYGPSDFESAFSLGATTINGTTAAQLRLSSPGLGSTMITQNSAVFKIEASSTLSCDPDGWKIGSRPIIHAGNIDSYIQVSTQQWKLTSTSGAVTTINICTK